MKNTEMKVVRFSNEDVIATSGNVFVWSGLGADGNRSNDTLNGIQMFNQVTAKVISYTGATALTEAVRTATGDKTISIISEAVQFENGSSTVTIGNIKSNGGTAEYASLNGVKFYYDTTAGKFKRI